MMAWCEMENGLPKTIILHRQQNKENRGPNCTRNHTKNQATQNNRGGARTTTHQPGGWLKNIKSKWKQHPNLKNAKQAVSRKPVKHEYKDQKQHCRFVWASKESRFSYFQTLDWFGCVCASLSLLLHLVLKSCRFQPGPQPFLPP